MTDRDLMQQALDALCDIIPANANRSEINRIQHSAIAALRERLAQPEQEPVAWVDVKDTNHGPYEFHGKELLPVGKHDLYTTPPAAQRTWVDLTDEQIVRKAKAIGGLFDDLAVEYQTDNIIKFGREMEAAVRERLAQPEQEPVEEVSVLIDGTAYTVQMPVAGEMLRLHLEILEKQPATVQTNCRHCGGPDNVICAGQCEQAAPPAAQPAQRKPLTDEQQRNGFRDQDSQWTFKGMSAWQVWQKACAWNEAAHGIKENT